MWRACKVTPRAWRGLTLCYESFFKRYFATEPAVDAVVVGAGVVGLAIGRALAVSGKEVIVVETAEAIGTQTSSRNSEVIHAGIYYPRGSLKSLLCVKGKQLLYDFCQQYDVPHSRLGKLLVATTQAQLPALRSLQEVSSAGGVPLEWLSREEVHELEPAVRCQAALLSPTTGIVDSHSLMLELQRQLEEAGGTLALRSKVVGGSVVPSITTGSSKSSGGGGSGGLRLVVRDEGSGEEMELAARAVVNSGGLYAQEVAGCLEGLDPATIPKRYLAKGSYFSLAGKAPFRHLIYPLPEAGTAGLGTHLTLDLGGQPKFGPDVEWLPDGQDPDTIDYSVDAARSERFYPAIRAYWPELPDGALQPSYSGVRPKVSGAGMPAGDFIIQGPAQHGVAGLVNLYGIESPGLTASLAIAEEVERMLTLQ